MEITTKSGFTCEIDPAVLDSMELLDAMAELQEGNVLAISRTCRLFLGEENRTRLYDHLRNEAGRVPPGEVDRELNEIMLALGKPAKN